MVFFNFCYLETITLVAFLSHTFKRRSWYINLKCIFIRILYRNYILWWKTTDKLIIRKVLLEQFAILFTSSVNLQSSRANDLAVQLFQNLHWRSGSSRPSIYKKFDDQKYSATNMPTIIEIFSLLCKLSLRCITDLKIILKISVFLWF